jgi:outer membrane protein assembly factor BamB
MKLQKNKIVTVALVLLLSTTLCFFALPSIASAHTPPWTNIPTFAYVSTQPNPVGVNQPTEIVMWIDKVPPSAAGTAGDRWTGYTIIITKPDGTNTTKGPFTSFAESTAFTSFTPTAVGTYTITFKFPGQVASLVNPQNGQIGTPSDFINDTFLASSASVALTAQQDAITAVQDYGLPTSYWTRPIEGQNTNWATVASNYLGAPQIVGTFQPDGSAPNSAHIMWAKPLMFGGVVGGSRTGIPGVSYYTGLSYEGVFGNPLIIQGRLYYPLPQSDNAIGGGYVCVDLQTGQQIWYQNYPVVGSGFAAVSYNPSFGQLYDYESFNQHGVITNGYLWAATGGFSFFGPPAPSVWLAYDPLTGVNLFNLTNTAGSPSSFFGGAGNAAYGPNGEILMTTLGGASPFGPSTWLALFNNTAARGATGDPTGTTSDAYQWRPVGKSIDASLAYSWNVTLSTPIPAGASVNYFVPDDFLLGSAGTSPTATFFSGYGSPDPRTVFVVSLKPATRGQVLWIRNYTAPSGNITRQMGPVDSVQRVFTMSDKETMQWLAYDLNTGDPLWGPVGNQPAFSYFGQIGTPGLQGYCAYGKLYTTGGYGSTLYCYDTRTGNLDWTYGNGGVGNSTNGGLDTPYGHYPLFIGAIADNKVYAFSSEHSPTSPMWKGEKVRCIDAKTGAELWTLMGWGAIGSFGSLAWPVADGYLVYFNAYDNQIYCLGKGPSDTTVTASPKVSAQNTAVLIEGTVTDTSAGAKQLVQNGEFTVVPAMSDASESAWMEHIYMQKPLPANATGVIVKLIATDPNGNSAEIGSATTDLNGNYAFAWTPSLQGMYHITAVFEGTNSYWGSSQTTYFNVGPAAAPSVVTPTPVVVTPTQTPTATQTTSPSVTPSIAPSSGTGPGIGTEYYIAIAAVIIIVAIVAVAVILRRRK